MAYCRWGSHVENIISLNDALKIIQTGGYAALEREEKKRGTILSDWYLYHDCSSGETKEEQILSIHHKNGTSILMRYLDVKYAYDNDDWSQLQCEITQKDFFRSCVKEWLVDMEEYV